MSSDEQRPANRLQHEQSPYLLQHQYNPVDWYPWGDEAFDRARQEDKPIFLSIGYSTCHWCHVMEHESFEDEEVARLMNDVFVSVKVDREERPDVDQVYMAVCQLATGHGGWPLTVVMTPDKKPFYVATYIPRQSRFNRVGMMDLVPRIQAVWENQREEVEQTATHYVGALEQMQSRNASAGGLEERHLQQAVAQFSQNYDPLHGGFGNAPKFPSPHQLILLMRYGSRVGNPDAVEMALHTLRKMRLGGLFDHVGGGFHRYSTDREWLLPHFEKMLYDQAMLLLAYTEAYAITHDRFYEEAASRIAAYVLTDLRDEAGGFHAGEDADSEGREGLFYIWHAHEIRAVLGSEAERFMAVMGVIEEGNFEEEATGQRTGENILHLKEPIAEWAESRTLDPQTIEKEVAEGLKKLNEIRKKRVRPGLDDKVLVDWNGLMIAALARGSRVLNRPEWMLAAREAAEMTRAKLVGDDGKLLHRYRRGVAGIQANIDDYAFLIWGLIELYAGAYDVAYLEWAMALNEQLLASFWDEENGGLYFSPEDGEKLLVRPKEAYDGAAPSGNSVAMLNMLRLSALTGNTELADRAAAIGKAFSAVVDRAPTGFAAMLTAVDLATGPMQEVVIVGDSGAADTEAMMAIVSEYAQRRVVIFKPTGEEGNRVSQLASYTAHMEAVEGKATAYVCEQFLCKQPVTTLADLTSLLNVNS